MGGLTKLFRGGLCERGVPYFAVMDLFLIYVLNIYLISVCTIFNGKGKAQAKNLRD
jgi:hypothetical protein